MSHGVDVNSDVPTADKKEVTTQRKLKVTKMTKDLKKIMAEYKERGWRIEPTANGHTKWFAPDNKTIVVASGTPGDHMAMQAHVSLLRKTEKNMLQQEGV